MSTKLSERQRTEREFFTRQPGILRRKFESFNSSFSNNKSYIRDIANCKVSRGHYSLNLSKKTKKLRSVFSRGSVRRLKETFTYILNALFFPRKNKIDTFLEWDELREKPKKENKTRELELVLDNADFEVACDETEYSEYSQLDDLTFFKNKIKTRITPEVKI